MLFSQADKHICYLKISTWVGLSPAATHHYGTLRFNGSFTELKRKVTTKDIEKDKERYLHVGDTTNGFDTEEALIRKAKKEWKKFYPKATHLVLGEGSYIEPHKVLTGDNKKKLNTLFRKAEKLGFYTNIKNIEKVDKLTIEWYDTIQKT